MQTPVRRLQVSRGNATQLRAPHASCCDPKPGEDNEKLSINFQGHCGQVPEAMPENDLDVGGRRNHSPQLKWN